MSRHLVAVIVCLTYGPFLPLALAQDSPRVEKSPPENPPQILIASSIDANGYLVLVRYKTIFIGFSGESYNERSTIKAALKDVQILTTDGNEVTLDEARKRISDRDTPILVSSYQAVLPAFYAKMFVPSTLHFGFPKHAPKWKPIQEPGRPVSK